MAMVTSGSAFPPRPDGYNEVHPLLDGPGNKEIQHSELIPHSIRYHVKYVLSKKRRQLELSQLKRVFPLWRSEVKELPARSPPMFKEAMTAVTDTSEGGKSL